jgi:tRNA uridine 5-carboxymethylaminomethyl modification enzyme
MIAGLNSAKAASGDQDRFSVTRADGYLGVMIDDLVTRGVTEPYRMFTSRAEYRLMLRADNADQRLTPLGIAAGCVGKTRQRVYEIKAERLKAGEEVLRNLTLTPNEAAKMGLSINRDGRKRSAFDLLSYPDIDIPRLAEIWPEIGALNAAIASQLAIDARYAVYVSRQEMDVAAFRKDEAISIPADFAYNGLPGLSNELRQKLSRTRPASLGQAARLDGMTPAALMLLLAHVKKGRSAKSA